VRFALCLLCSLLVSSLVRPAAAQPVATTNPPPPPPSASLWRHEWPTFSRLEGVATVAAGIGTGVLFVLKPPPDPRWQGGILFDDAVRDDLRLHDADARRKVRAWGDLPYFASPILPLIVDPLLVAWLARGDRKAAFNLEAVALESFAYAGLLSYVSTRLSVRERPDSSECRREHPEPGACTSDTESFYSGHTTIAAASAGIVCATHRAMPLWGHPAADASACAVATAGAVFSGVSRILADRHYATDVLAGFGMGFGLGYAVPTLLHFSHAERDVAISVSPGPCDGACLRVSGSF
jgi:membrane-associated phospholipid phosphatase